MGQINPGLIVAGRYRLLRKLGQGGMGTVWSARNELIDREVAIKMMRPEAAANPVSLQRFFTEAKASGRLRHPNITEIYDLGQAEDGSPFLVLELLTGEPLDAVLRRVPVLAPVQVLLLGKAIGAGLNVAHAKGIVHRDLKPANIFLHRDPITLDVIPKVLDFGISKVTGPDAVDHHATHTGTVVGSPTYMSPEQARGVSDIDARADVWSVGVLLYKCLTGRAPFNAANYNALMVAIMTEPHPPVQKWVPTCPTVVSDIIDDCLKKERVDRIASAKALMGRIDSALLSLNAERAKLELPSDDIDDDMPTIARGNRADLVQLITATSTVAPQIGHLPHPQPQPQLTQAQQYEQFQQRQQQQQQRDQQGSHPMQSVTPQPQSDGSATSSPTVVSSPDLHAIAPQHTSGTQPAALRVELDPIAAAKKRDRNKLLGALAVGAVIAGVLLFVAIKFTRPSGASAAPTSTATRLAGPGEPPSAHDTATAKTPKKPASPPVDPVEALEPAATATVSATVSAKPTAATTTATAATATTAAPIYTAPQPTYTAPQPTYTAPKATATAPTTAKPPGTAATKKPTTTVNGPGF